MEASNARIVHGHRSGRPLLVLIMPNGVAGMVDLAVPLVKERAMTKAMNGVAVTLTENEMIEREVDARLAAEVEAKRAAMRLEVIDKMRREAFKKRMDAIAAHCREVDAAQLAFDTDPQRDVELAASRKAMLEKRAAADARWAEAEKARAGREGLPRGSMRGTGHEGFQVKR
jgi:hypothetical protein